MSNAHDLASSYHLEPIRSANARSQGDYPLRKQHYESNGVRVFTEVSRGRILGGQAMSLDGAVKSPVRFYSYVRPERSSVEEVPKGGFLPNLTEPNPQLKPSDFPIKYDNKETGFNSYGYRYYDPVTGRAK